MLTPSMDYEVGKGRMLELERKLAVRRLVAEAQASQRLQQPSVLDRLVERMKEIARWIDRRDSALSGFDSHPYQTQQPTMT
ncbi:MAG: hypothetical protein RRC07_14350 [Anaerolineae bacterium]|nr:hypothetical protein [Anaerolineae bacterium]